jgi:hypothetical protein
MAAGFLGTVLVTLLVHAFAAAGYAHTGLSELFGGMLFEARPERFSMSWWIMMAWHFNFGAVIFPHVYVLFAGRELPGAPWQKGLLMGLALWLLVELLFKPLFGMGLFSSALPSPALAVMASLLVHAVYGITLGGITGHVQTAHEEAVDRRAAHHGRLHLHARH